MKFERGGFALGLVVGLLVGLSLALAVALYITKAPMPFVNKVPPRTAEQDSAEAERNKHWDPNAALSGRAGNRPPATADTGAASAPAPRSARDPAAILAGAPPASAPATTKSTTAAADPFTYFVQIGAFTNAEDAEQQRAKAAMAGMAAKVSEREQAGRTVFRVRLGPFDKREEAEAAQSRLNGQGFDARLVRVERSSG